VVAFGKSSSAKLLILRFFDVAVASDAFAGDDAFVAAVVSSRGILTGDALIGDDFLGDFSGDLRGGEGIAGSKVGANVGAKVSNENPNCAVLSSRALCHVRETQAPHRLNIPSTALAD
jgi:hypothetical protein